MGRILNTIRLGGVVIVATALAGCGSDASDGASAPPDTAAATGGTNVVQDATSAIDGERPQIVVTTNILGNVVSEAVGDQADVEVIMPLGTDPHDFAPSAQQAEAMENADLLVVNGAGFEEGMLDVIENVSDSGTEVFSFADQIDLIEFTGDDEHGDDEHADEEEHADEDHGDDEHADEEEEHGDDEHHHEGGGDPHLWTDPTNIATGVEALQPIVAGLDGVDASALSESFDSYGDQLDELDSSMRDALSAVPDDQRVLVTNHEVFGYFAQHFDFDVVGAIIPSLTTNAEPSAKDIEELADAIETENISAIFAETTSSSKLAGVIADEVGSDVEVVELFTESLGEDGSGAATYIDMMQSDADLIAGALSS